MLSKVGPKEETRSLLSGAKYFTNIDKTGIGLQEKNMTPACLVDSQAETGQKNTRQPPGSAHSGCLLPALYRTQ